MGEVGDLHGRVADDAAEALHAPVRQLEEFIEQPELVHDLERRGMNGVAAEIAQEVGVLLQHHHVDAGAREQEAEHHAGGPAAGDAACGAELLHSLPSLFRRHCLR